MKTNGMKTVVGKVPRGLTNEVQRRAKRVRCNAGLGGTLRKGMPPPGPLYEERRKYGLAMHEIGVVDCAGFPQPE